VLKSKKINHFPLGTGKNRLIFCPNFESVKVELIYCHQVLCEVGAYPHQVLSQFFIVLNDNDIVVHADGSSAKCKACSLLHFPIG